MSEDKVYDPQKEAGHRRYTRRKILGGLAAMGVVGAIGFKSFIEHNPDNPENLFEALLQKGISPVQIHLGDIEITKGDGIMLNVRSSTNAATESSTTQWLNIEKWNGENIRYGNSFIIKNCPMVEGQNTSPQGSRGEKGLWIPGLVETNALGAKKEDLKFVSYSSNTARLVRALGGEFHPVLRIDKTRGILTDKGFIAPKDVGVVIPLTKAA